MHDKTRAERDALRRILLDFERQKRDVAQLAAALAECAENAASAEFAAALDVLARRLEMVEFSVCAAEQRGAVLDLIDDFRRRHATEL